MTQDNIFLGNIEISPDAIELIASIAIAKTKGVHHVQGNTRDWVKRALLSKGTHLTVKDNGEFIIDAYVALNYGVNVPQLAQKIQERVKEQILFMCDITITQVNVHITDLVLETGDVFE